MVCELLVLISKLNRKYSLDAGFVLVPVRVVSLKEGGVDYMGTGAFGEKWEVGVYEALVRLGRARGRTGLERSIGRRAEVAG